MAKYLFRSFNLKPSHSLQKIEQVFFYLNQKRYCSSKPTELQYDIVSDLDDKPYAGRRSWRNQDTEKLIKLVGKYGNKWKVFESYFPGRTAFCIRSHYFSVKHDTTRWTLEEKKILQNLLVKEKDTERINWEYIQQSLPKKRTIKRIQQFYQNSVQESLKKGNWTKKESQQLLELVDTVGKDWLLISKKLGTRSEEQCRNKYSYEMNTLKKGEFSKEEDKLLLEGVKKYGLEAFQKIKEEMNSKRSVSQLKTRYSNHLDPTLDKSPWSKEEKDQLINLYSDLKNLKLVQEKMDRKRSIRDMYNQLRGTKKEKSEKDNTPKVDD